MQGASDKMSLSCQQRKRGLVGGRTHDTRVYQVVSSFAEGSLRV